jgi:hypothetical protein
MGNHDGVVVVARHGGVLHERRGGREPLGLRNPALIALDPGLLLHSLAKGLVPGRICRRDPSQMGVPEPAQTRRR